MALRSYSPQDVDVMLAGIYKLSGFVEGSFINIAKDVQPFKTKRSADGQIARTLVKDDSYTVEITLASSSPDNDILSKLYQLDVASGLVRFPFYIKDTLGSSQFLATTAWIKEIPEVDFSDNVTDRTWTIQCAGGVLNIGGNEDASEALEDIANAAIGSIGSLF